jgi:hypothetical protein
VDPTVGRDQRGERIGVGAPELLDLPVPQDLLDDRVLAGEALQ